MKSIKNSKRLAWADSLKGWLMMLVILGHSIQCLLSEGCEENHLWNMIYSFHMPAFIAVSGWLAYRPDRSGGGNSGIIIRRFKQLIIPYLIWSLLSFITRGNYNVERLSKIFLTPDTYYWFLWVLFWIFVLFWVIQRMANRWRMEELSALWLTAGLLMVMMVGLNTRYLGFRFIAYYFLFYVLGYSLHKLPVLQIKNKMMIAVMSIIWIGLAWGWSMHELPPYMSVVSFLPSSLVLYAYRGITAIVAIEVILYISPVLLNSDTKLNTFMMRIGTLSLGIYAIHIILIDLFKPYCQDLMLEFGVFKSLFLLYILVSLISIAAVFIINKNKLASRWLLGKL